MIVGAPVEEKFAQTIRAKIQTLLASKTEWFSGAEPEHICESDLDILEQHDYFMSKKGSGLRTMLFIFTTSDGPAAFLWTSRNALWYNPMMFPLPNNPNFAHTDTLIDGELNFTKTNSDQPPSFTYTAFDLVAIGGVSVAQRSLSTRLGILQQDIIKPRNLKVALKPNSLQPFRIEMAHHERSYAIKTMAPYVMTQLGTGLIFTPVKSPYVPNKGVGITKLFQWEFPEFNCCSFKLHVVWDKERKARYQLQIADRQSHKYFDDFSPEPELLKEWKSSPPDGKIIDCRFDKEWETIIFENGYAGTTRKGGWRFCRFRLDKHFADEERSMRARWSSLISPVTLDMFNQRAELIRTLWKLRERRMSTSLMSPGGLQSPSKMHLPFELKRKASESIVSSIDYDVNEGKKLKIETSTSNQSATNNSEIGNISEEEEEEEELEEGYVAGLGQFVQPGPSTLITDSVHDVNQGGSSTFIPRPKITTSPADLSENPKGFQKLTEASKPPLNRTNSFTTAESPSSKSALYLEQVAQKASQIRKVEPNYIPPPPVSLKGAKMHDTGSSNLIGKDDDPESPIEDYASVRYNSIQEKTSILATANQIKIRAAGSNIAQLPISSTQEYPTEQKNSEISDIALTCTKSQEGSEVEPTSPEGTRKQKAKNSLAFLLN